MKYKIKLFLLGFPDGLRGKIELVERGETKYTLWDRLRYRLIMREGLE